MPYLTNSDLPKTVRDNLPEHGQTIYRNAWTSAAEANPDYDEEQLAKIAWGAVKKVYHKVGDKWVRADVIGAEVPASNYDAKTHIVKAIKVGTVAHSNEGIPFECTFEWLQSHADDWTGGKLIANHYGSDSKTYADIERSWFDGEFEMMQLTNMDAETERRMLANEHTGFSFDAVGTIDDPTNIVGTNLSILFYPHTPACSAMDGCGLAADELQSQDVKTGDIPTIGSEAMENKTYTVAEIESMKAESAKVAAELATLKAEAKTHESEINVLKAEISARNDKISELTETAATLFAAEDVEKQIADAKATMFSAEDVEAAKKEAAEAAIAAEKEKMERIAAEIAAITKMFPEGLAEDFRTEIIAMVKDGKSHEAILKLGEIEYTAFKAQIPTAVGDQDETEDAPTDGFTVGACKEV